MLLSESDEVLAKDRPKRVQTTSAKCPGNRLTTSSNRRINHLRVRPGFGEGQRIRVVLQGCRDLVGDDRPSGTPAVTQLVHPSGCPRAVETLPHCSPVEGRRLRSALLGDGLARPRRRVIAARLPRPPPVPRAAP